MKTLATLVLASILSPLPPLPPNVTIFNGIVRDTTGAPVPTGNVLFTLRPGIDTTTSGNARFTPTAVSCAIEMPPIVTYSGNGTTTTVTVGSAQPWQIGDSLIVTGTGSALDTTVIAAYVVNGTGGGGTVFTFLSSFNSSGAGGFVGGLFSPNGTGPCTVTQNSAINPAYTSYGVAIQPGGVTTSSFNTYAIGPGPIDISTIVPTPGQQPAYSFVDLFSNGQTISGLKNFTNTGNTYSGGTFNSPTINNAILNTVTATNWTFITPTIQQPTFTTQPITLAATFNYTLNWANPTAPRSITIPDPGVADQFVFQSMAAPLNNKTLNGAQFGNRVQGNAGVTTGGLIGLSTIDATQQLVNQTVSIPSTALTPSLNGGQTADGLHRIDYYLMTSTAAGGTSVTLTLSYTDFTGTAQSFTTGTINLNVLGSFVQGSIYVYNQLGTTVNYSTTVVAIVGSKYNLVLVSEAL